MKIDKKIIIEKMDLGFVLVEKFDRMYGKYYYLYNDGNFIWNINLRSITTIIKNCKKTIIDPYTNEYILNK